MAISRAIQNHLANSFKPRPGAGAEVVFGHGGLEHREGGIVQGAVGLRFARAHPGVAGDARWVLERV
jgi:hypothetical protein